MAAIVFLTEVLNHQTYHYHSSLHLSGRLSIKFDLDNAVPYELSVSAVDGHNDVLTWITDYGYDLGMDGDEPDDRRLWLYYAQELVARVAQHDYHSPSLTPATTYTSNFSNLSLILC